MVCLLFREQNNPKGSLSAPHRFMWTGFHSLGSLLRESQGADFCVCLPPAKGTIQGAPLQGSWLRNPVFVFLLGPAR